MEGKKKSVFETLNAINCNEHIEKKNGLSYLSWAWAWSICKQNYPEATYTIYERENGIPYFTDGKTAWVKTGVTINGQEHIEYLPIMDFRNNSIPVEKITSMDMNKTIQRSLTKALARHGLGLYVYAGEDIPEAPASQPKEFNPEPVATAPLESTNVANLFPTQDMPDTIMDDLSVKILAAKNGDVLKEIWKDAQVLLAQRPDDMKKVKSSILKRHKDISDGKSN